MHHIWNHLRDSHKDNDGEKRVSSLYIWSCSMQIELVHLGSVRVLLILSTLAWQMGKAIEGQ